jgi:thiamine pyrophosphate-dependent acetolactate synthase large subunit-like protein
VRVLATSTRPLLLAGGGALASGAGEAITAFAGSLGVPVATTINGKGAIDERHLLAAGVVGAFGSTVANQALPAADTVLVIGSKLGQLSTFGWRVPADDQTVVHVDVDATEIGRAVPVDLGLVGDAREAVVLLHAGLTGTTARWNWYVTDGRARSRSLGDADRKATPPAAYRPSRWSGRSATRSTPGTCSCPMRASPRAGPPPTTSSSRPAGA